MAKECNNTSCDKASCEGCSSSKKQQSFQAEMNAQSNVKHVIGVVSGKGGVGKSFVTGSLANLMASKGYKVGIMDADITGPSIPKAFGVHETVGVTEDNLMVPARTYTGIQILSANLILERETDPVIWRGPIVAGVVKQFWSEALWEDVDYMFVDMPPGTGDVPLTVFQTLPVDGIIIVSSPQELVGMIVGKAVQMAEMMKVPILGIVENMSYVLCPDCGKKIDVFGESHVAETAAEFGVPVLARIPIDPQLARQADLGVIESFEGDMLDGAADAIEKLL